LRLAGSFVILVILAHDAIFVHLAATAPRAGAGRVDVTTAMHSRATHNAPDVPDLRFLESVIVLCACDPPVLDG